MSLKVAAVAEKLPEVVVRAYDEERDKAAVEELESRCEVGQEGKPRLVVDLLDDPIGRVRNAPLHLMMVAEHGISKEIVGVIRGSIRTVTRGKKGKNDNSTDYVDVAYILGLRVSSQHRRLGIGTKLVQSLENWSRSNGAEYIYMATDCSNQASINLFTGTLNYVKFRTPSVLVQPVHRHKKPVGSDVAVVRVPAKLAESYYHRVFDGSSEFFPKDINLVLNNKLNLGTFMAVPKESLSTWDPDSGVFPPNHAILSIWDAKEVYKVQVKGLSGLKQACFLGTRVLDRLIPWLRLPSVPNVSKNFGYYFLYGLRMEGNSGSKMMESLCAFAHNVARNDRRGCELLIAEVSPDDPVRRGIPHWKNFSWQDLWCIKELDLVGDNDDNNKAANIVPGSSEGSSIMYHDSSSALIFVDPRDI
nr:probable N-acetyltransferase HLS1 [Ipomoea batatas]